MEVRKATSSSGQRTAVSSIKLTSATRLKDFAGHLSDICHLEFMNNMRYLISSSLDCTLRVWDIVTAECRRLVRVPSPLSTFKMTLNGDILVGGTEFGQLLFIDLQKNSNHAFFKSMQADPKSDDPRVRLISLSPDEKYFSVIKKNQIDIIPMEEVFKVKQEFEVHEKNDDKEKILQVWQRDYKTLSASSFENERFDFVWQKAVFNNTIVVFCRNTLN